MAEYSSDNRYVVAAIDFGTTYSGYTYSFRKKPLEVKTNQVWIAGSEKLFSPKTPTCVLLDPEKNFFAFGFEAENKYGELADDNKHKDWYFFRRFKMVFYENKDLTIATEVEDIRGKRMDAMTIFSHAIRYMVEHSRKSLDKQTIGVKDEDIQYVLTVPAIWNDKAKQFMRKAATKKVKTGSEFKAVIPGSQLLIALEPEAASIWGQILTDGFAAKLSDVGSKYIVADIGGGTADITGHQKMYDGKLKELHRASGGPWGGTMVDKQYLKFLESIFGQKVMDKFVKNQTSDYIDLLRDFEAKKRTVSTDSQGKMVFRLPASLREMCESERKLSTKEVVARSQYSTKVSVTVDKLRLEMDVVKGFFMPVINDILSHMADLLRKPELKDIKIILLVGGFGECPLLENELAKRFPEMKLIVPPEASLTVLKGVVRFGHMRDIICCRKSKYEYGRSACPLFNQEVHPVEKKIIWFGEGRCSDVFYKLVDIGEAMVLGKEVVSSASVLHQDQTNMYIAIYYSENKGTRFVTDPGCNYLGQITVPLPESDKKEDKNVTIRLCFWDTEIKVIVKIDKTGEEFETVIDCI